MRMLFSVILSAVVAYVTLSSGKYIFEHNQTYQDTIISMLEWASAGYNWKILLVFAGLLLFYGMYRALPHMQNWNAARRGHWVRPTWTWKDESGWWAMFLAKVVMVWAVFGMQFHH